MSSCNIFVTVNVCNCVKFNCGCDDRDVVRIFLDVCSWFVRKINELLRLVQTLSGNIRNTAPFFGFKPFVVIMFLHVSWNYLLGGFFLEVLDPYTVRNNEQKMVP